MAEMKQLSPEGESSLRNGNWVVKINKPNFHQDDPDQAQEQKNGAVLGNGRRHPVNDVLKICGVFTEGAGQTHGLYYIATIDQATDAMK